MFNKTSSHLDFKFKLFRLVLEEKRNIKNGVKAITQKSVEPKNKSVSPIYSLDITPRDKTIKYKIGKDIKIGNSEIFRRSNEFKPRITLKQGVKPDIRRNLNNMMIMNVNKKSLVKN